MKPLAIVTMSMVWYIAHGQEIPISYTVTEINPGGTGANPTSLAEDGTVSGTRMPNENVRESFIWKKNLGYQIVPRPIGCNTMYGKSVSGTNMIIGQVVLQNENFFRSFKYDPSQGFTFFDRLTALPFSQGGTEYLHEINAAGDMMFHYNAIGGTTGSKPYYSRMIKANGEIVDYGIYNQMNLPLANGYQSGIQNLGQGGLHDFVVRPNGTGFFSGGWATLQDDGDVIGAWNPFHIEQTTIDGELVWTGPTFTYMTSLVSGRSANRSAFVGKLTANESRRAYMTMWGGQTVDLTSRIPSGIEFEQFIGLNDAGMMLAKGKINNRSTYFVLDPVPEPGTMLALGAGLAALAKRRRKK